VFRTNTERFPGLRLASRKLRKARSGRLEDLKREEGRKKVQREKKKDRGNDTMKESG